MKKSVKELLGIHSNRVFTPIKVEKADMFLENRMLLPIFYLIQNFRQA